MKRHAVSLLTLVLLAPAGFGRIGLAEAVSLPGLRHLVQAGLPWALSSPVAVTAGYLAIVTNGTLPDQEVVRRVTSRAAGLVGGAREGTRAVFDAGRERRRFIVGASTTRGRFSQCGATAIASCRPPTATVCRPRSPRLGSSYGQAWATTRSPSASIDCWRSSRAQLDSLQVTPSRRRGERLPPAEPSLRQTPVSALVREGDRWRNSAGLK